MRVVRPAGWRKSSYSNATGGNCVEVAQTWRTSSYSGGDGGNCVEVSTTTHAAIPVRDSKDTARGHLLIPAAAWASLTDALK